MEVWKPIAGYEGLYEVSNYGRVRSIDRYVNGKAGNKVFKRGFLMKAQMNAKGYKTVVLHNGKNIRSTTVHRLVAEAFIPNPENKKQINHIDADKTNNCTDNLEWNTQEENMSHAKRLGLHKGNTKAQDEARKKNLLHAREQKLKGVDMYSVNGTYIKSFPSITIAAEATRGNPSHISAVCRGKRNYSGGYRWRYSERRTS